MSDILRTREEFSNQIINIARAYRDTFPGALPLTGAATKAVIDSALPTLKTAHLDVTLAEMKHTLFELFHIANSITRDRIGARPISSFVMKEALKGFDCKNHLWWC